MKKAFKICRAFIVAISLFSLGSVSAQTSESELKSLMKGQGWTISSESRYAYLREDQSSAVHYRTFFANYEYTVVAFSEDSEIDDIDVEAVYTTGDTYLKDDDLDDVAVIRFSPSRDIRLGITMTNYSSWTPSYFSKCNFIVFYRRK